MNIGLDVGTHWFRSLRQDRDRLTARRCRAIYALLDDHPAQRRLLNQLQLPFALCADRLLLPGNSAAEFSGPFPLEILDIFSAPAEIPAEPVPRQVLALLVDSLLPAARTSDAVCCFSLSRGPSQQKTDAAINYISQLARLRGYRPQYLPAGMALILAETAAEKFTGIAVVAGASACEASVAHGGREIASSTLPQGGTWIDEQLATETAAYVLDPAGGKRLDREGRRRWKEGLAQSLLRPFTAHEKLLTAHYRELAAGIVQSLRERLAAAPAVTQLPQPLPVVCGGGSARAPGFVEILRQEFDRTPLPVTISTVRAAGDPLNDITRGCLIHAELDAAASLQSNDRRRAA